MPARLDHRHQHVPVVSRLLLSAGLLLPAIGPVRATAAEPERRIEVSSGKTDDGQTTVTVVISGIPPEELGEEGMKALLGYLAGRRGLDTLVPRANAVEPETPGAPGVDRDQKEFDLELNIHWKRTEEGQQTESKDELKRHGELKKSGEPKSPGELKSRQPVKEGGTALDSIKRMISGGPAPGEPAKVDGPVDAKKGETRRNAAEVDAILRDLGSLQKQIIEQTRSVDRVKGLAESADKIKGGPESAREMRKVAEAAAELEKLTREIEQRSKAVEQALDRARAKLSEAEPGGAGRPKEEPKKKPKKRQKPGRPKKVDEPQ